MVFPAHRAQPFTHSGVGAENPSRTLLPWSFKPLFKHAQRKDANETTSPSHVTEDATARQTGTFATLKAKLLYNKLRPQNGIIPSPQPLDPLRTASSCVLPGNLPTQQQPILTSPPTSSNIHYRPIDADHQIDESNFLLPPPIVSRPRQLPSQHAPIQVTTTRLSPRIQHQRLKFTPESTPASSRTSPALSGNSQLSRSETVATSLKEDPEPFERKKSSPRTDAFSKQERGTSGLFLEAEERLLIDVTNRDDAYLSLAQEMVVVSTDADLPLERGTLCDEDGPNIALACKMYASSSAGSLDWWSMPLQPEISNVAPVHDSVEQVDRFKADDHNIILRQSIDASLPSMGSQQKQRDISTVNDDASKERDDVPQKQAHIAIDRDATPSAVVQAEVVDTCLEHDTKTPSDGSPTSSSEKLSLKVNVGVARWVVTRLRALIRGPKARPVFGPRLPTESEWIAVQTRATW
ncbi:hypothetical protein FRB97_005058 [Tulasnella sp. 331]|nr:hypothetical protein FRB97_005058 [Tulasnella sp. 331]